MIAVGDVARFVKVRDIGEFRPHPPMLADREMPARVHRPERGGEGELLFFADLLVAEHEHREPIHRRLDLSRHRGIDAAPYIDPLGAGGKKRV
jgi:hypothetical protein